jgi:hypothetical protein
MKNGDLVRFKAPYFVDGRYEGDEWLVGLLIEYRKWEKMATIMYEDKLLRLPGRDVQKYGKRYLE